MSDPLAICLVSLHKFIRKFIRKLNALRTNLNHRRKQPPPPKTMLSGLTSPTSSVSSIENQLKQVFEFLDANGDGKLSPVELREVLLRLGHDEAVAEKDAEWMVKEMDRDGDGLVDIDEFMGVVNFDDKAGGEGFGKGLGGGGGGGDELMDAFMVFDKDKNGFISAKELQRVLVSLRCGNCSLRECRKMIRGVDRDGNGLVDFEEFRSMMSVGFPR